MRIFSNSNGPTTIRNAFLTSATGVNRISLAAPFFSYPEIVEEIATGGREVSVLVRLCSSTPADALQRIANLPKVSIRFITSRKFHSKLYIFGDRCALVGSANLTQAGLQSNREIGLLVPQENPDFDELVAMFQAYWNDAMVLDGDRLRQYAEMWARRSIAKSPDSLFDESILGRFGDVVPSGGVQVGVPSASADQLFLEDYRRSYQEFLHAFREVESIYRKTEMRRQEGLPLRIEIDQFFSFVREHHCPGEVYLDVPIISGSERAKRISHFINEWFGQPWPWLDEQVVSGYPRINERLGNSAAINASSMDEIIDAIEVCHAFKELRRFYLGGEPAVRKEFAASNDIKRVKATLVYLLHGKDPFIDRMGAGIFDPALKLSMIGRSVVQELLGWVNNEDVPICNGRTMKSLRFLGFNVAA